MFTSGLRLSLKWCKMYDCLMRPLVRWSISYFHITRVIINIIVTRRSLKVVLLYYFDDYYKIYTGSMPYVPDYSHGHYFNFLLIFYLVRIIVLLIIWWLFEQLYRNATSTHDIIIYNTTYLLFGHIRRNIYAVNWCVSRWNGRDTIDVIFFFISRPGGLTREKVLISWKNYFKYIFEIEKS